MRFENPFHEGEIAVQERSGERAMALRNGRGIGDRIMPGALKFVAQQPMVVCGSVAPSGEVWASVFFGTPGFVRADEELVSFDLAHGVRRGGDPLWSHLAEGAPIGLLFIELATRRRLRVNGTVTRLRQDELEIRVREAYPNCPKYIQRRRLPSRLEHDDDAGEASFRVIEGVDLSSEARAVIETADTLFVASAHAQRGVDASHRGGPPGFVKVVGDRLLRVPDYAGNGMFNTLGNLAVNSRAGLAFVEFGSGDVLQLTGRASLQFDASDPTHETGGTGRSWDFQVDRWILSPGAAPRGWEFLDASPFLPERGVQRDR